MHNNNNYQCKICWNKALTYGVGYIDTIQFSYIPFRGVTRIEKARRQQGMHMRAAEKKKTH